MIKVLIVDDSVLIQKVLTEIFSADPSIQVVGVADDPYDARDQIKLLKPDVITLDIEMPNQSGLDILEYFPNQIDFKIIFVTAYNQYAIEAFKLSAVDYLLKPVDTTELKEAIIKAEEAIKANNLNDQLNKLRDSLKQLSIDKIALAV